jgi:hypothetical protein
MNNFVASQGQFRPDNRDKTKKQKCTTSTIHFGLISISPIPLR